MNTFRYVMIFTIIGALVAHSEAGWLKKAVKKVGNAIKKVGCKVLFGVACPAVVQTAGAGVLSMTRGSGEGIVAAGVEVGTKACHVRQDKCKRSVSTAEIVLPFSDNFSDYDTNDDKQISYEEFVFAVLKTVDLANPEELRRPFKKSDVNDDGYLSEEEFDEASLLFAHAFHGDSSYNSNTTRATAYTRLPEDVYL